MAHLLQRVQTLGELQISSCHVNTKSELQLSLSTHPSQHAGGDEVRGAGICSDSVCLHLLVRRQLQQRGPRQDNPLPVPLPYDGDDGAAAVHLSVVAASAEGSKT